ncbi:MAG TPA: hypothetical protein VF600_09890 [Abditibacteriaceae bacterium]
MKLFITASMLFALLLAVLCAGCRSLAATLAPPRMVTAADTVFTSTRQVTCLLLGEDNLWVGTSGGVLQRSAQGQWRKWTRADGLPSHEVRNIAFEQGTIRVITPRGAVQWNDDRWVPASASVREANRYEGVTAQWRGQTIIADLDRLVIANGAQLPAKSQRILPFPPSSGTHISALTTYGEAAQQSLWAAVFGDGLWQYDGERWQRLQLDLPREARDITALAYDEKRRMLWLGTRRNGVWSRNEKNGEWTQFLQTGEMFDHNVQALTAFGGVLAVSTLEDGLCRFYNGSWQHESDDQLSSVAPRQMAVLNGTLYVRHGSGKIDSFDGQQWTRDVFSKLPRKKASAIAANENKLFVAQWGGWSEWDGATWTHFLAIPELQGLSLMSLYPDGDRLWIGTQKRGLGEYSHRDGRFTWHDERHGMPDDWITCITKIDNVLYAGTFVGGLARYDGKKWHDIPQLRGENVTALEANGQGSLFIATRNGVWQQSRQGTLAKLPQQWLDTEAQALLAVPQGLLIGMRTGLFFVVNESLKPVDK